MSLAPLKLFDLHVAEGARDAADAETRLAQPGERHPLDAKRRVIVQHDRRSVEPRVGLHRGSIVADEDGSLEGPRQCVGPLDGFLWIVTAMDEHHRPEHFLVDTRQFSGGSSSTIGA